MHCSTSKFSTVKSFADLEDKAEKALKELLINWDWNDPAHHYDLK